MHWMWRQRISGRIRWMGKHPD